VLKDDAVVTRIEGADRDKSGVWSTIDGDDHLAPAWEQLLGEMGFGDAGRIEWEANGGRESRRRALSKWQRLPSTVVGLENW
jgi:hypothetical protein